MTLARCDFTTLLLLYDKEDWRGLVLETLANSSASVSFPPNTVLSGFGEVIADIRKETCKDRYSHFVCFCG